MVAQRPMSKDRTQDAELVEGSTLRNSARGSMLGALAQQSAGVYVTAGGVALHGIANGASGGITIRGLGGSPNSQILVVEDGVPDYQGIFGHPIPDAYVPFLIDEVLIIKGGDSVLYGTNAMGGVLVIRNRWREQEGYELQNDAAYGSYQTLRERLAFLGRFGRWDVATAFQLLDTQGHRDGAAGRLGVGHLAARLRVTPNLHLSLRSKVVHLAGGDPGTVSHPYEDHWYDVWRSVSSLALGYRYKRLRLSATAYLNAGIHRLYDGFLSHDYVGGGIVEAGLKLHRTLRLLLGAAAEYVDGRVEDRSTGETLPVHPLTNLSFYNQLTWRPLRDLSFVAGTRELYSTTYGFELLYKAGARWNLYRGLFAHTRIVKNFRQPTIRELYLPYPTANPDLKPELSLSWDFTLGFVHERVEVSCTAYRSDAHNLIKYFGAWPSAEVVNIDELEVWGVSGRLSLPKLGPAYLTVTANWQHVGRYTRQNPEAKLNYEVGFRRTFGPHFIAGAVTGEWVHGLFMSNYGRDPIDDVFFMDLTLRYRYTSPSRKITVEPYLLLRNFLDRRYAYIEGYIMPGLNLLVGLKLGI